jgi:hypothetical protein
VSAVRWLAVTATLLGWESVAFGEAGSPSIVEPFDSGDMVATNALIPLLGINGVPVGLAELKKLEPRLVKGVETVPLRAVDSFDDLEGHATPFPSDGGGYGNNLILMAPRWRLTPNAGYAFTLGQGADATTYFNVATGGEPDTKPPQWRSAPLLDLTPVEADEPVMPSHIITALDEPAELPFYVVVRLEPLEPRARPKRLIAALHLPSSGDSDCSFVTVWDHARNVHAEDTDSDLGRRYLARLTAIDAAGNRRNAPGTGVPIVWSGGIAVCNRPAATPSTATRAGAAPSTALRSSASVNSATLPAPPRWLGAPVHRATSNGTFNPSDDVRDTQYEHTLQLPVAFTSVAVVELTIRRLKAPFTSYRRVGLLWPTTPVSTANAAPTQTDGNCVEPLITNTDREKPMPTDSERVSVRVTLTDALGRRISHRGAPLIVSNLHPHLSQIRTCASEIPAK